MKQLFCVNASKYTSDYNFDVYWPASLDNPKDNAVMFMNEKNVYRMGQLNKLKHCIIYYPRNVTVVAEIKKDNLLIPSDDPRTSYCLFFRENKITFHPVKEEYEIVDGAFIAKTAKIGSETTLMPFVYIGGEVTIGDRCYIGCGSKIVGNVRIGNDVVIRENTVIGADGLSTDRDTNGRAATMPQFGGVIVEDDVQVGANCVIARGAIDNTTIKRGCKIDNSTFISHNVFIDEDTFIVGETIMFGGASTGKRVYISGNSTVRNKIKIGNGATVGMGSVVTKNVEDESIVFGNPAHKKK